MKYKRLIICGMIALAPVLLLASMGIVFAQSPLNCNPEQSICIGSITLSAGFGNSGGGIEGTSPCPSGSALTGINVGVNSYLRKARSSCNGLVFDNNSGNITPTGSLSNGSWIVNTPPGSLTDQQSSCPIGAVVVGYNSRSGLLVDGVQVICQSLLGNLPAGPFSTGGYAGGNGGNANPAVYCPAEQVAVGIAGRAGDGLDYFRLQCAPLYFHPVANTSGPYSGDEGSVISLDGTSSYDPGGDSLAYSWTADSSPCSFDDATSPTPGLTCNDNGEFNITLNVNDGVFTASITTTVTVTNVSPILAVISDQEIKIGQSAELNATFTDPGLLDTHSIIVTWEPGKTHVIELNAGVLEFTDNYEFKSQGKYLVTVTVIDKDGGSLNRTFRVTVQPIQLFLPQLIR